MLEQAEETTGTRAQMTLADAGYFAASHLAECTRRGQRVVVSESRQRFLKDPYHKDQFTYERAERIFPGPGTTAQAPHTHANGVATVRSSPRLEVLTVKPCHSLQILVPGAKEIGRSSTPRLPSCRRLLGFYLPEVRAGQVSGQDCDGAWGQAPIKSLLVLAKGTSGPPRLESTDQGKACGQSRKGQVGSRGGPSDSSSQSQKSGLALSMGQVYWV